MSTKTCPFEESWKADSASNEASLAAPYPGTELYEMARQNSGS